MMNIDNKVMIMVTVLKGQGDSILG